jgi:hypothetical protein
MTRFVLERDVTRLKVVHRQRVQRQGDADPAPPFSPQGYGPKIIGSAAAGWQTLLETEYESVVIAGWMTAALARLGAPLDILGAFGRIVEDEIRHVDVCAQMVEVFGARPTIPRAEAPPFPVDIRPGTEAEFETLAGMISFFCVFEHLSGLVFHEAVAAARADTARWALSEIYRDEAFHGAFGYETAKIYVPRWPEAWRARLAERVTADVRRFEERLGGPLPPEAAQQPLDPEVQVLEQLGLLSPPALLRTFYAGVSSQLVPRMKSLEIPIDLRVAQK